MILDDICACRLLPLIWILYKSTISFSKWLTRFIKLPLPSSPQWSGGPRLATAWLVPPCQESSVPSWRRSTSRPPLWPSSSSSSSFPTSPSCRGSSSHSIRRRGDSSSSGSTPAERWGAPAGEESGGRPGRRCCTLPGCVFPSPGARVGWKNPEGCIHSHPWLWDLFGSGKDLINPLEGWESCQWICILGPDNKERSLKCEPFHVSSFLVLQKTSNIQSSRQLGICAVTIEGLKKKLLDALFRSLGLTQLPCLPWMETLEAYKAALYIPSSL